MLNLANMHENITTHLTYICKYLYLFYHHQFYHK